MDCFEKFDPLEGDVPLYPFYGLFDVAWKAREFLEGFSKDHILRLERDVDAQIEHVREFFYKQELKRISSNNKAAIEAFEEEYEEPSEVEALSFATEVEWGPTDPEEPSSCPVKCAAVLALMFVADCIETLECPEEELGIADGGPIAARLIPAANNAFNAALALGLALKYERHIEFTKDMEVETEERLADFNRERARRAALRKHGPTKSAKAFVLHEWTQHRAAYNGNKSAFARDYVRRLRNEQGVVVTEKQLREVWLKDTQSASKPDGLPVGGQ